MIHMGLYFLDQRRVQADGAWVGAGRKDARKDKHVADEERRLHVVVRLTATLRGDRMGVRSTIIRHISICNSGSSNTGI